MRNIWSGVIAASFVATVGLSAQQAPPTSAPAAPGAQQPAPSGQASGQSRTVTVSGCIQNAPAASATATAGGASASASAAPKFVLATKPAPGAAGGGAVGTSGTAMRYQLDGEEKTISPPQPSGRDHGNCSGRGGSRRGCCGRRRRRGCGWSDAEGRLSQDGVGDLFVDRLSGTALYRGERAFSARVVWPADTKEGGDHVSDYRLLC